ncbi:molybdate ABC transporter permease subunit [Paenibacillus endoradicis]|uniref:molybdate ABC transporter permease subunit n=1 Tax=Paenibacillus endoradicis TaxID=2972487 RepID=UPI0021597B75|nr:molybdate ABC transporter permease subunit [Paenibacillus endoradicis]MCR8659972.1 molybdate ABC transporter permease subunit [Paenibacillus endoradicis]
MNEFDWGAFIEPILISIKITIVASIIVFILAIIVSRHMSRAKFRCKLILDTFFMIPLVLPPTVIGFILLFAFGKKGFLGQLSEIVFGQSLVFTWWAGVIAAIVVAFPLVYQTMKAGFDSIDSDLEAVARSLGATEWQVFRYVALPLNKRMLVVAFTLGFARSLGEFGATLMLAGNIPGRTQTVATAIYVAIDADRTLLALAWVAILIIFSFIIMYFVRQPAKS